jgi:hypothetical protein
MNTLFESMLKHYREKQALLTTQKTLRGKDMTSVFQHGKASAPEEDKIYVEDEVVEVPTLFQHNKISTSFMNPQMVVRQSSRVVTSPKTH